MKLFKKLLPIATIASTAAIVVPMVTSCGQTVLTNSKLDFVPEQHDPVEGGWSEEEATKEFCSNPKYLAQELAYEAVLNGLGFLYDVPFSDGHQTDSESFKNNHDNASYEFVTSLKNMSYTEKTAKIDGSDVKGYLLSGEIIDEIKASGDKKDLETSESKENDITTQKATMTMKDIFVYVTYDSSASEWFWDIHISGLASASENWSYSVTCEASETISTIYKDGHSTTDKYVSYYTESYSKQNGCPDKKEIISNDNNPIASYYLKNISKKA